jgi:lambda family phage portal protein
VITRIEDIKDYEESERVAAKIAAMLTGYIKKGESGQYGEGGTPPSGSPRSLELQAGTFVDDLNQGEDIVLVDTKRPNPNLITFRGGQLRAAAAGLGSSYSSLARDYNGTYSAQRQELVEQWVNYAVLTDDFVSDFVQPAWENFVSAAVMSGAISVPRDVQSGSENDAIFVAQQMPWIDPLKEATACETLVQAGFASEVEMIRKRGATPTEVLEQIAWWRKACTDRGISFTTNPAAASQVIKARLASMP